VRLCKLNKPLIFLVKNIDLPFGVACTFAISDEIIHAKYEKTNKGKFLWQEDLARLTLENRSNMTFYSEFLSDQECIQQQQFCQMQKEIRRDEIHETDLYHAYSRNHTRTVVDVMRECGMEASGRRGQKKQQQHQLQFGQECDKQVVIDQAVQVIAPPVAEQFCYPRRVAEIVNFDDEEVSASVTPIKMEKSCVLTIDGFRTYDSHTPLVLQSCDVSATVHDLGIERDFGSQISVAIIPEISLAGIVEQVFDQRHLWSRNNFTMWLNSAVRGEQKYHGGIRPYTKLIRYLPDICEGSYLDYGCGSGYGAVQVANVLNLGVGKAYCVDHVDRVLRVNRNKLTVLTMVDLFRREFEVITVNNVLHHIGSNFENVLDNLCDMVQAGGRLIIRDHKFDFSQMVNIFAIHCAYELSHGHIRSNFCSDQVFYRDHILIAQRISVRGFRIYLYDSVQSDVGEYLLLCIKD